jgi:predicted peroxiredoxin
VALPFAGAAFSLDQGTPHKSLNIMMKSAWGSDDPTKAAFPFLHGLALSEAGHSVQIFLLGEAVSLMRKSVADAVVPVGWPPLEQALAKVAERHMQIYACGACSRAGRFNKQTLTSGGRSLATQQDSFRSWNGLIASSRSSCQKEQRPLDRCSLGFSHQGKLTTGLSLSAKLLLTGAPTPSITEVIWPLPLSQTVPTS